MDIATITPTELAEHNENGATIDLIDVRTPIEFQDCTPRRPQRPLGPTRPRRCDAGPSERMGTGSEPSYIICRSGSRGRQACEKFWPRLHQRRQRRRRHAGLGRRRSARGLGRKTVSLERQVRIAAGSLVCLGALLAWLVHPAFIALSAFVGAGLIFAGVTDTCGMALLLARMPWNRAE